MRFLLTLVLLVVPSDAWITPQPRPRGTLPLAMNLFSDLGDLLSGGKLEAQTEPLPYGAPLAPLEQSSSRTLAIQERAISFTGEDFNVYDENNQLYAKVSGAMLHLPGKDQMKIQIGGATAVVLDRKLVAMTPTYDILRGNGEKIGWIEKATIALTDTFDVYLEGSGVGPFKAPPMFKVEGDFLDRRFVFKNGKGQVVAKVTMDQLIEFDAFNHYQVQIAPGMDAALVIACACAVDEEFDEEHKKRREAREKKQ